MDLLPIIGVAAIGTALCILLKQYKPEYAMIISLVCCMVIFLMAVVSLQPAFQQMEQLLSQTSAGANAVYAKTIIKALGICYLVQIASDSCRDAGETAIAGKVELAGKVAIVLLALPLFQNLAEIALDFIQI